MMLSLTKIYQSYIRKPSKQRPNDFIVKVKKFVNYIQLDKEVEEDISQMVSDFSFYNSLYKKFQTVFDRLQILPIGQSRIISSSLAIYQKAYWTLYILSHKQILDKRSQIIDSLCLLGAIFFTMLRNKEMNSRKIVIQGNGQGLVHEICEELIIKDFTRFESLLNDYVAYLQTLRLKEVLRVNWNLEHKILVNLFDLFCVEYSKGMVHSSISYVLLHQNILFIKVRK